MRNFNLTGIITGTAIALSVFISLPIDAQTNRRGATHTEQRNESRTNSRSNQGRRPSVRNHNPNHIENNHNNINRNKSKKQQTINNKHNNNNGRPNDKGNKLGHQKPDNGNHFGQHKPKPQPQHKPHHSHHYGHLHNWKGYKAPPARPYRPKYRHITRIAPPPHWRPYHNAPIISGVLGLTFGTLYHATLDYLYTQNFIIDGYTDNIVYLRNVPQYNYNWDDVMLNYVSGRLTNAQFVYSNRHYDTNRYNSVYLTLRNTYGSPISMRTLVGGGYECIWYGGNSEGMVTLEYYNDGGRYYTTLSFGGSH